MTCMFDVISEIIYYFMSPRRLLTAAPHKIITNNIYDWLTQFLSLFDALMHYRTASKLAHVQFFTHA